MDLDRLLRRLGRLGRRLELRLCGAMELDRCLYRWNDSQL